MEIPFEPTSYNPDNEVLRQAADAVGNFTVSLLVFPTKSSVPPGRGAIQPLACATGVLLEVGVRQFILTAGHAVDIAVSNVLIIPSSQTSMVVNVGLDVGWSAHGGDGIADWGVLEVHQKERILGRRHSFPSLRRLGPIPEKSKLLLYGMPDSMAVRTVDSVQMRALWTHGAVAGRGSAPARTRPTPDIESVELWLPTSRASSDFSDEFLMGPMGGLSGGGVWSFNVAEDGLSWDPTSLRLVATHSGSFSDVELFEEKPVRRTIATGIRHHIEAIIQRYPALKTELRYFDGENGWPTR